MNTYVKCSRKNPTFKLEDRRIHALSAECRA